MAIKDADYNKARSILVEAGSKTAEKSHEKHTGGKNSPDGHGKELLREAVDEFRKMDVGKKDLKAEMTQEHYDAIHDAASKMNLESW